MRHEELGGPALVPASALDIHRAQGWMRVSEAIPLDSVPQTDPAGYADAPDLDAPTDPGPAEPVEDKPEPAAPATNRKR